MRDSSTVTSVCFHFFIIEISRYFGPKAPLKYIRHQLEDKVSISFLLDLNRAARNKEIIRKAIIHMRNLAPYDVSNAKTASLLI